MSEESKPCRFSSAELAAQLGFNEEAVVWILSGCGKDKAIIEIRGNRRQEAKPLTVEKILDLSNKYIHDTWMFRPTMDSLSKFSEFIHAALPPESEKDTCSICGTDYPAGYLVNRNGEAACPECWIAHFKEEKSALESKIARAADCIKRGLPNMALNILGVKNE